MNDEDNLLTQTQVIVTVIEGLLYALTITEPSMLEYISDYAAQLREESKKYD